MSALNQNSFPEGWKVTTVGHVCEPPQYGYTTKATNSGDLRLLRTTDITSGAIDWDSVPYCSENPSNISKYLLEDGDVVISRAGSVGVSYLILNPKKSVFASYLIRFRPKINKKYFKYFLDSPFYWNEITENKLGIAVPNVNASKLKKISFPLPTEGMQKKIVAKIEELFSELDNGIASLKTAREQLKVYRQAVLKHAFEGKLTAQWRKENADKLESPEQLLARIQQEREQRYQQQLEDWKEAVSVWEANGKEGKKPSKPKALTQLSLLKSDLPQGWSMVSLDWLLTIEKRPMATGPFGTALKKSEHQAYGVPVLGIENIGNGKFLSGNKIFVDDAKAEELEAFRVHSGDIVISRSGTVGEICEVPEKITDALISTNLLRVSLNSSVILSQFFVLMFQGGGVKLQVKELCKGSSREFLNQTILKSIHYPVCGIEEQKVLLEVLETIFSNIDQQEKEVSEALAKAETLRQSILKKAFSGQLVDEAVNAT